MAFVHGKSTKVLIGAYDLSTSFKEASGTTGFDMAETSAFGNTYKTYVQGLGDASISLSGMWDAATGSVDDVLGSLISSTTTTPVSVYPAGYGIGNRGFGLGANESSYEITSSIGDVVSVSAEFQSTVDTGGKSGVGLFAGTSLSATGNQTSVNNLAATTNGGYALFHLPTNSRSAAVDVKIQDSADNASFADICTFTQVASGVSSEYKAITGTIRQYVRAVLTLTAGTGACIPHVLLVRT
jgi:hypothetical protein